MKHVVKYALELHAPTVVREQTVTQNDAIEFVVTLLKGGEPIDMTGVTPSLAVKRRDGVTTALPGTVSGNTVTFALGSTETAKPGTVYAAVQLYGADGRVSSLPFTFQVKADLTAAGTIPSEKEATLIEVVLQDGPAILQRAETAAADAERVAVENKTNWLDAVATVAERDTAYPNPLHGDTVRVTGTATVYRFEDGKGWVVTDQYQQSAVDALNQQLADTAKNNKDYVKMLQAHNVINKPLQYQIKGDRKIDVWQSLPGEDKVLFRVQKDVNDDFMKTDNVDVYGMTGGGTPTTYWTDYGTISGGTMNTSVPPNHFATTPGTKITTEIDGTEFLINHYIDNRGGVWQIEVDGVVARTFSTHIDNILPEDYFASNKARPKVTGLSPGKHTVVLTFLGDDPEHPPASGAGNSRGWISNSQGYSIPAGKDDQFYTFVVSGVPPIAFNKKFGVMVGLSNKEPVVRAKKAGTEDALHFFPEHNSTGTAFAKEQYVLVDGVEVTDWTVMPSDQFADAHIIQTIQTMNLVHPQQTDPLGTLHGITTFNSMGMTFSYEIEWHTDVLISAGYAPMVPVDITLIDSLKTSHGRVYALDKTDGSRTYLTENDRAESYIFYNRTKTTDAKNYALAYTVNDIYNTFRQGQSGRHFPNTGQSMTWVEHRTGGFMNKLYPQVFDDYTAKAGERTTFNATYFVGHLFNARRLV